MNWARTQAGPRGSVPRRGSLPWVLSEGYLCLPVVVVDGDDGDDDDALVGPLNSPVALVAAPGTRTDVFSGSFHRLAAVCHITRGGRASGA